LISLAGLKSWARNLKRDIVALWLAARDPRVPLHVKLAAGAIAAYALSPIDLVPDFIPILGYLDDLIIVPIGVLLVIRMLPPALMAELRRDAERRNLHPASYAGLIVIVLIWLLVAAWLVWLIERWM
jgi:uncharacterized membrane protein YkvA (DUF1232 family)